VAKSHEEDPDGIAFPYTLPLSARQVARGLIPSIEVFEELLLWPPDLFAFTSYILSITGAYHLAVSPPRLDAAKDSHEDEKGGGRKIVWPPERNWTVVTKEGKLTPKSWQEYVREVGMLWRHTLELKYEKSGVVKFSEEIKRCKDAATVALKKTRIYSKVGSPLNNYEKWKPDGWVPREVGEHWITLYREMGEDGKTDIEDILCETEYIEDIHGETEEENLLRAEGIQKLKKNWKALEALLTLHAIVDEACIGWGIRDVRFKRNPRIGEWELEPGKPESAPAQFAAKLLEAKGTMATINARRGRVLPKRHTPSIGITLRSLTNNLAFHRSSVDVKWKVAKQSNAFARRVALASPNKIFSVLLLPWPRKVSALDFKVAHKTDERLRMTGKLGCFHYSPQKWFDSIVLKQTLKQAQKETEKIDMVILPESAITTEEVQEFEQTIGAKEFEVSAYVAGVRNSAEELEGRVFADNMVYCKMGEPRTGEYETVKYDPPGRNIKRTDIQYKHHRWKIDRYQIENYSLGHALSPFKGWWEAIKIRRRKVTFINVGSELTICPLICEDLARQDPIADLIRTVGPSMVITILMDGPQKRERWSARYASVLSEDPGSAVITLTSAGMVDRWRHPYLEAKRVVALWNDGQGAEREIVLEQDAVGILLSLSVEGDYETSADGRKELYKTNRVILGGAYQVRLPSTKDSD
jgi:hypothetical protein